MNHLRPKFAEFFAGVGLVRLGLEQAGWDCVFANDIDEKKLGFYRQNFDADDYLLKDIWEVETHEIPDGIDLYSASFPCVDLSVAGNRAGINAARSGTYWAFVEILKKRKAEGQLPRAILLENVRGFLTSNEGKDVSLAIESLNDLGYVTDIFALDARHFTPQSRPRVFVVGILEDLASNVMNVPSECSIPLDWVSHLENQHPSIRDKQIQKVIFDNPNARWGLLDIPHPPLRNSSLSSVMEFLEPEDPRWWTGERHEKTVAQMKSVHLKCWKIKSTVTSRSSAQSTDGNVQLGQWPNCGWMALLAASEPLVVGVASRSWLKLVMACTGLDG